MSTLPSRTASRHLAVPAAAVLMLALTTTSQGTAATATVNTGASFGSALRGAAPAGDGSSAVAVDPGTNTIYVANGNNANGTPVGGNTLSVIDGRRCQAARVQACQGPWPTVSVGNEPSSLAVDPSTHTVYVANIDDNTVSVVDGRSCNGQVTSGCGRAPAVVPVGSAPIGVFVDRPTHTVFVGNFGGGTVSMIDTATCNAAEQAGCPNSPPPTVQVGAGPGDIDVNPRTHTAYVATADLDASSSGLTAFDTSTCNATTQAGCDKIGVFTLCTGCYGTFSAKVDPANNTVYEGDGDTTVAAIDVRSCNASDLAGCATARYGTVELNGPGFEHLMFLAVDATRHTVYGVLQKDDTVIAIDANVCNGAHTEACSTLQPETVHTGTKPESLSLNPDTHTLYVANEQGDNISVIDAARCNADVTVGCRRRPPVTSVANAGGVAVDKRNATAYVASSGDRVAMVDTRSCNAFRAQGCAAIPATVRVGEGPAAIAVDEAHHTAYVANHGVPGDDHGSVSVLDTSACDSHPVDCRTTATVQVPAGSPTSIAVSRATHAVYVGAVTADGSNTVSVFDGTGCSAARQTQCGEIPSVMTVGPPLGPAEHCGSWFVDVAANALTDTVYATNVESCGGRGRTVYVFDGSTCGAADTSGCGGPLATVEAGLNPYGLAVDQSTNTVYAALLADGEGSGSVAVIDGATCDRSHLSGCEDQVAVAPAEFGSIDVAVDSRTHQIYVANIEDTSVSVIKGARCNSTRRVGCQASNTAVPVDDWPNSIAVDPSVGTAYVTSSARGTVSVIPLEPAH